MGEIDNVFGATLCGTVAAAWIFGLITVFSYQYYTHYSKDPIQTRLLVAVLWFIQLFNQVVCTKMTYYYLVSNFNNPVALGSAPWEWPTFIGLEAFSATMVQFYYAWRIYKLTRSWFFSFVIVLISLCQLAFGLGTMAVTARLKDFNLFLPWTWISLSWLGCSAGCDIIVAATQVWYLRRNNSGIKGTDRLVQTLIISIMSTGILTTVAAILEISTFAALGFNFVHVFISYPNGGLYVLSLLANLHVRRRLRKMNPGTIINQETRLEPIQFKKPNRLTSTDRSFTEVDSNTSFKESILSPLFQKVLHISLQAGIAAQCPTESTLAPLSFSQSR